MEPTSEQELKELLEEGKISEEEYGQLLDAMCKKSEPFVQEIVSVPTQSKPKHGLGLVAFFFMLASFLLIPATILVGMVLPILLMCGIIALILGIIAFSSVWGKITVIFTSIFMFVVLPVSFLAGMFIYRFEAENRQYDLNVADTVANSEMSKMQPKVFNNNFTTGALISHKYWPLDSLEGVLTKTDVELDKSVSADGNGSLKIVSQDDNVIRLFETGPMSIKNCLLFFSAKMRSENLEGKAFLEMWCNIAGRGEFFSRGIDQPISGTTEWTTVQTPFRLEGGQMPSNLKLNLIVEGSGTVWIDDIRLFSSPLN
jgi:hypothetical protein